MKVLAVGRDNAGQLGDGTLAVIDNHIDQTTGTIKLKATFQNDDLRLWPGEFVNARLLLTTRKTGSSVPASVVQRGPQGSYAFVIKADQTVEVRPVKVAQTEDGLALIDDGLKAGERGGGWPVQAPGWLEGHRQQRGRPEERRRPGTAPRQAGRREKQRQPHVLRRLRPLPPAVEGRCPLVP